jgi:hypothetical protein
LAATRNVLHARAPPQTEYTIALMVIAGILLLVFGVNYLKGHRPASTA